MDEVRSAQGNCGQRSSHSRGCAAKGAPLGGLVNKIVRQSTNDSPFLRGGAPELVNAADKKAGASSIRNYLFRGNFDNPTDVACEIVPGNLGSVLIVEPQRLYALSV